MTVDEIVGLDIDLFGVARRDWVQHLYDDDDVVMMGFKKKGKLIASLALRPRKDRVLALDMCNGVEFADISSLIHVVMVMNSGKTFQCFARTGSKLHKMLTSLDFEVPAFFQPIGPLVEYRLGDTGAIGTSDRCITMSWM